MTETTARKTGPKRSEDVGESLASEARRKAGTKTKRGQGDKGDR